MAGNKLSPRQKMIGMMYLVLTALLALNVSKDILDAFILVNNGLENTLVNYKEKNNLLYNDLDNAKAIDPKKVTPIWQKAQEVKTLSNEMISYLDELKTRLIKETDKLEQQTADTIKLKSVTNKDNYDIPTLLLIGQSEDGSNGLARELKNKLSDYKVSLTNIVDEKDRASLKLDIKTEDVLTHEGQQNWEVATFYNTPLAATITLLSKIQTDIKNAEHEVISKLMQSISKHDFKFDTIAAKLIPTSSYVMLGEKYQADVFVAAFSTTQNPEIYIGEYDSASNSLKTILDTVSVIKGMGKYSVPTSKEGFVSYEGMIKLKSPMGEVKNYPFKSEYIVAKPSLVVSPDKMNVFYIGPKNPVSVSVPGVASENLQVTISSGSIKKVANGKYEVTLPNGAPKNVSVSVSAKMPNGTTRSMGSMPFVAKKLPMPLPYINKKTGQFSTNTAQLKAYSKIYASYGDDFLFQGLPLTIVKCKIELLKGNMLEPDLIINNGLLGSEEVQNLFKKARKNDRLFFSDIWVTDITGRRFLLEGGIQIKIN